MKNITNIDHYNKYLIDYSNLKNNLIKYQKNFLKKKEIQDFLDNPYKGIPLLCPFNANCFDHNKKKNYFKIKKKYFQNKIFLLKKNKQKYIYADKYFLLGDIFCSNLKVKKSYHNLYKKITNHNIKLKKLIFSLKKKNKIIGSFQTRNIPHYGHERIIKLLFDYCDIVIINPVIGPKKKGDIKPEILARSFNFLKKKYKNKLLYFPVYANMFYAGPREAAHHANLREMLGFDYFIVGRDHAGAEGYYDKLAAQKIILKFKNMFKINIITHSGSYFCKTHKKIVIKDECKKKNCRYVNISGKDFRNKIKNKKIFRFARKDLQKYLFSLNNNLFYN